MGLVGYLQQEHARKNFQQVQMTKIGQNWSTSKVALSSSMRTKSFVHILCRGAAEGFVEDSRSGCSGLVQYNFFPLQLQVALHLSPCAELLDDLSQPLGNKASGDGGSQLSASFSYSQAFTR